MNQLKTFLPYLFGNKGGKSYLLPNPINWETLNFEEVLMFKTLKNELPLFFTSLNLDELSQDKIFHLLNFKDYLTNQQQKKIQKIYERELHFFEKSKNAKSLKSKELQELLNQDNQMNVLFAILNPDRSIPGRLFFKKSHGTFHHEKQKVWNIPILGHSGRGLNFHHSNGNTPLGVYLIDSVMPEANNQMEYGQFRRLKVQFIQKSHHEKVLKSYLPNSHHGLSWWAQACLARDMGRSLLRIHGTGRVNYNPFSSFYPMTPSSGCLTTLEKSFFGLRTHDDQNQLLKVLMEGQNLNPVFENELKIHSLLYVVEYSGTYQTLEFSC